MEKVKENTAGAESKPERNERKFTKSQILSAARYRNRNDLVSALLDDGRLYTIAEVDQMVSRFMKGKVR